MTGSDGLTASRLIDRSVLAEWMDGDEGAVDRLLGVFRDSARAEYVRMRDALASGDLRDYARAAHRLRGTALAMGAPALAETAAILDSSAQAGDGGTCGQGMFGLGILIDMVAAEIPGPRHPAETVPSRTAFPKFRKRRD